METQENTVKYFEHRKTIIKGLLRSSPTEKIGEYNVLATLQGGMGKVHIARNDAVDEPELSVLKSIIPPSGVIASQTDYDALVQEALAMTEMRGYLLLHIEGTQRTTYGDTGLFLVTRYCDGGSLRDRIRFGPIPIDEALVHLVCITQGLASLHTGKIAHCDLKPENALISSLNNPLNAENVDDAFGANYRFWDTLLSDFGLAELRERSQESSVKFAYTPAYAAPEQMSAGSRKPSVDIWALGIIIWELITGSHPYHGTLDHNSSNNFFEIFRSTNAIDFLLPEERFNGPDWLYELLRTCLLPDAEQRIPITYVLDKFNQHIAITDPFNRTFTSIHGENRDTTLKGGHRLASVLVESDQWETSHDPVTENGGQVVFVKMNYGWPMWFKQANDLFEVGSASSHKEAMKVLEAKILGSFADDGSTISTFFKDPTRESYQSIDANASEDIKKNEQALHLNMRPLPIPRQILLDILNLRLMLLFGLMEEQPATAMLDDLDRFTNILHDTRQFVDPEHLIHMAQAFLLLGQFEFALSYVKHALEQEADEIPAFATLERIYKYSGDFNRANEFLIRKMSVPAYQERLDAYWKIQDIIELAGNFLDAGDPKKALSTLSKIDIPADISVLISLLAKHSLGISPDFSIWPGLFTHLQTAKLGSPYRITIVSKCAWVYGKKEFSKSHALQGLADPKTQLPMHKIYHDQLQQLSEGKWQGNDEP